MKNKNFLQSEEWRKFQEKTGKRTFHIEQNGFWVNIIEHKLPIAGSYFYIPRWPSVCHPEFISGPKEMLKQVQHDINEIISLARKEKAGWVRIDIENNEILEIIRNSIEINENKLRAVKAPHDMQPKEIFVIDIEKSEDQLLAEMKSKTRYNIKLAEKKGVKIWNMEYGTRNKNSCIDAFLRLVKATAERKGIKFHPENYYRKMIETIPGDILKLYCAEYNGSASTREDDRSSTRGGKIIAANLVAFYGDTATYLHGATDDEYRNVMAPHLLQWQVILDAKKAGCKKYDFGGVKAGDNNSWSGITKFKLSFSQDTKPLEFSGSYDIITNKSKYLLYRVIQKIKTLF